MTATAPTRDSEDLGISAEAQAELDAEFAKRDEMDACMGEAEFLIADVARRLSGVYMEKLSGPLWDAIDNLRRGMELARELECDRHDKEWKRSAWNTKALIASTFAGIAIGHGQDTPEGKSAREIAKSFLPEDMVEAVEKDEEEHEDSTD